LRSLIDQKKRHDSKSLAVRPKFSISQRAVLFSRTVGDKELAFCFRAMVEFSES
jgi:hypothetical protein